jgi:hypothetical protein
MNGKKKTRRSLCLCVGKLRSVVFVQLHTKNPLSRVFVNRHVVHSGSASLKIFGRQEYAYKPGLHRAGNSVPKWQKKKGRTTFFGPQRYPHAVFKAHIHK